ncbi:MAG: hypothetical protein ACNA7Y_01030 [Gammaproteobacteria bacterium]
MGNNKKAVILRLLTEAQQAAEETGAFRKILAKLQAQIVEYIMNPEEDILPPIVIPKPEPEPEPKKPTHMAPPAEQIAREAIPANAAAGIVLDHGPKWEGLLEQTEEAVQMIAERFDWTGEPNPGNSEQILYTYANGLKIIYSKTGVSYYDRNIDDAQIDEILQQKESELAYAWVELIRPSILVEPVILSGRSKEMLEKLITEFSARRIQTVTKTQDKTGARPTPSPGKGKGFFQSLSDAARRLDQFGRYLDKGR